MAAGGIITPQERSDKKIAFIADQFTGGNTPIGSPANYDGILAYNTEQAQKIFENLTQARVKKLSIPFLADDNGSGGRCVARKNLMLWHMIYHQQIDSDCLGIAVAKLNSKKDDVWQPELTPDYRTRIAASLDKSHVKNSKPRSLIFHVAPTIKVFQGGKISDLVLDPAICNHPVSLDQWALHQRPKRLAISVCHRMFNPISANESIQEVMGSFNPGEAQEYFNNAHRSNAGICSPAVLAESSFSTIQHSIDCIDASYNALDKDRNAQRNLIGDAKMKGMQGLTNCGPKALKEVHSHLRNTQLSEPSAKSLNFLTRLKAEKEKQKTTVNQTFS